MDSSIDILLKQARTGDSLSRERLIQHYRPFVIRAASHVCKRSIQWHDDEASISLIAFNEAIDRYNDGLGKNFDNFAFTIIHNRLVDEFRKNSRSVKTESFSMEAHEDFKLSSAEIATSMEFYERQNSANNLAQELLMFRHRLIEYGIRFDELEDHSPEHKDSRIQLIRIAKEFSKNSTWMALLERNKKLPLKEMLDYVSVSKRTLERNRKYLISLILIYNDEDFGLIRGTISFAELGE